MVNDIQKQKNKKIMNEHLSELDIIIESLISELFGDNQIVLTPNMLNDIFKIAFQKWEFLYNHGLIKKDPLSN